MTIELDPVEVPRGGATTGRRPGYARTSPTSTAGVSDDATALVHWREAVRPFQDADNLGNAGLTACYGAWTALRRSSPAEAAELFLTAADLHRRTGDLDREVWALIGLTAAYAEVGQHAQARDVLTSLHQRISADHVWHPGVMTELALRTAVLDYLANGVAPYYIRRSW